VSAETARSTGDHMVHRGIVVVKAAVTVVVAALGSKTAAAADVDALVEGIRRLVALQSCWLGIWADHSQDMNVMDLQVADTGWADIRLEAESTGRTLCRVLSRAFMVIEIFLKIVLARFR
jgi:hypothetical protein